MQRAVTTDPARASWPRRALRETGWTLGRSLFPAVALVLIAGSLLWGPWVTLVLGLIWWKVVTRIA